MKVKSGGQCLAHDEPSEGLRKDMTSRQDNSSCTAEAAGGVRNRARAGVREGQRLLGHKRSSRRAEKRTAWPRCATEEEQGSKSVWHPCGQIISSGHSPSPLGQLCRGSLPPGQRL